MSSQGQVPLSNVAATSVPAILTFLHQECKTAWIAMADWTCAHEIVRTWTLRSCSCCMLGAARAYASPGWPTSWGAPLAANLPPLISYKKLTDTTEVLSVLDESDVFASQNMLLQLPGEPTPLSGPVCVSAFFCHCAEGCCKQLAGSRERGMCPRSWHGAVPALCLYG